MRRLRRDHMGKPVLPPSYLHACAHHVSIEFVPDVMVTTHVSILRWTGLRVVLKSLPKSFYEKFAL